MAKNIELHPLLTPGQSKKQQLEVARQVKQLVYEDFLRVGATEEEVRSFADPTDEKQVQAQLEKLRHAEARGLLYVGIVENNKFNGLAKIGPWLKGDDVSFKQNGRQATSTHEHQVGLYDFSVREGLAQAALKAIYFDLIDPSTALKAAVHKNDAEVHQAFTDLGASEGQYEARIKRGSYMATFVLRELPPSETTA